MTLIDKEALIADIDRRTNELWVLIPDGEKFISDKHTKEDAFNLGKYTALESFGKFIDTLEVKEVDLEKEIQNVIHNHFFDLNGIAIAGTSSYATVDDMVYIAKHFFELGLKAKQG